MSAPIAAAAAQTAINTVGAGGYDLVSYRTGEKPLRGNGNHVVVHDGVTYLFSAEANKKAFAVDPEKYLPAYGGYCAYGVAKGAKFVADPDVWEIVDGRLYLNLDNKIKGIWLEDVPGNLEKAEANWPKIENKDPSEL
jgi:YHS domain-containing protein